MPCPPLVPISIIPPVSQGPSPILWQNGNQITRLNTPLNPSWLVYDGTTTSWRDGSAQAPIYLPNLLQVPSIQYVTGINSSGQFVISSTTPSAVTAVNLAGGTSGVVPFQSGVGLTSFTAVGTSGQILQSNGTSAPTWINSTSTNTASAVVQRDASGNFSAGTITASLTGNVNGNVTGNVTGNASTATTLQTARSISITGAAVASGVSFDGSANIALNTTITNLPDSSLATISTAGKVANSATTATNANTANSIVSRDASGNFSAGTVTASLSGNATSSSNLLGGTSYALPYQSGVNNTSFLSAGTNGQVLGILSGALAWVSSPAASSASNLVGGSAGVVPWQSAPSTTAFTAAGTTGQVLTSNGTSAPTWSTNISGQAGSVANGSVTPAKLSTGGPSWDTSGNVGIGTSSPSVKLQINGAAAIQGAASYPTTGNGFEFIPNSSTNQNSIQSYNRDTSSWMNLAVWANDIKFLTSGVERLKIDSSGIITTNGNPIINCKTTAKAWVNFNGTTATPSTIRSSYNVSSITKNGTGDYTVNFATAMADANYAVCMSVGSGGSASYFSMNVAQAVPTVNSCRIFSGSVGTIAAPVDAAYANVQIFGN